MIDLGDVYARYSGDVLRFALYLSGDRALAEDIAAETFVRALTARGDIKEGSLKAYLFTIARHLYIESGRRQARRDDLPDEIEDPAPGPDAIAAGRAELHDVLVALRALPEIDRAALLMRVQDDMPYAQIAVALGLSVTAAKVKVHRARLKLNMSRTMRELTDADHS